MLLIAKWSRLGHPEISRPFSFAKCSRQMKHRWTDTSSGLPAALSAGRACMTSWNDTCRAVLKLNGKPQGLLHLLHSQSEVRHTETPRWVPCHTQIWGPTRTCFDVQGCAWAVTWCWPVSPSGSTCCMESHRDSFRARTSTCNVRWTHQSGLLGIQTPTHSFLRMEDHAHLLGGARVVHGDLLHLAWCCQPRALPICCSAKVRVAPAASVAVVVVVPCNQGHHLASLVATNVELGSSSEPPQVQAYAALMATAAGMEP